MSKITIKLSELKTKAELYMNKRNQIMRNIGCGMMEVINELEPLIIKENTSDKVQALLMYHKEEILREGEPEGIKRDMELRYDGMKLCGRICDGGRTNKKYFDRVINSLIEEGYIKKKFTIIIGKKDYIQ
tara:strand:+ start:273 stop:662 length:390 start_codon:yes stop_codon:yes gene_type:complete